MRAVVIAMMLVVAACAGGVTTEPAPEPQTLQVLLADDWASAPAVVDALQDFEAEHPGVQVAVRGVSFGQIEEAVRSDLAGPRQYDLVQWHAFAAGANGFAQQIDKQFAAAFEEDYFVPGAVSDVTWAGHVYGVPLDVNAVVMLVNVDALAKVGHTVDDLATWDGVREVAGALQEIDVRFTHVAISGWSTFAWVRANGGTTFEFDGDGGVDFTFDDPATVEAFELLQDLVIAEQAYIPAAQDVDVDGLTRFIDGDAAVLTTGSWDVAHLTEMPVDFAWQVVGMPAGPSADVAHTVLGGSSLYVSRVADDADLAFELAAHLIDESYAIEYAKQDGRLPPHVQLLDDPFFDDPRYRVVVDHLPYADPERLLAFPTVTELYTDAISDILENRATPQDALAAVQQRAEQAAASDLSEGAAP